MAMFKFDSLIGGAWVRGNGEAFATVNPARPQETVGSYSSTDPQLLQRAGEAAAAAQAKWRRVAAAEWVKTVTAFFQAIEKRAEEIARSITLEQGKPMAESRGEVSKSLGESAMMAGHAMHSGGEVLPNARAGFQNMVVRRPRGVIAAITPWNFPILTPMRKMAPALLFGNAILLKPSEFTPAAACLIGEAALETLPEGLLQIVLGGADVGAGLVSLPQVSGITFTGSVATGRKIYALGAERLAELSLELGGKNAAVVNDVADLDACLDQIAGAAFMCAGQRCTAVSRVIVAAELETEVCEGLVERARRQVLGDGAIDGTTLGPLTNAGQLERVDAMVKAGVAEGAAVLTGGDRASLQGLEDGYFYAPTVLGDVKSGMSVARDEIFGPVISVLAYANIDEAFTILNGVDYGLTSSLFSDRMTVIQRFVKESESGMLHVNHGTIPDNHMPFGGIKNSGVGAYSVGASAAHFYTTEHSVYVRPQ